MLSACEKSCDAADIWARNFALLALTIPWKMLASCDAVFIWAWRLLIVELTIPWVKLLPICVAAFAAWVAVLTTVWTPFVKPANAEVALSRKKPEASWSNTKQTALSQFQCLIFHKFLPTRDVRILSVDWSLWYWRVSSLPLDRIFIYSRPQPLPSKSTPNHNN